MPANTKHEATANAARAQLAGTWRPMEDAESAPSGIPADLSQTLCSPGSQRWSEQDDSERADAAVSSSGSENSAAALQSGVSLHRRPHSVRRTTSRARTQSPIIPGDARDADPGGSRIPTPGDANRPHPLDFINDDCLSHIFSYLHPYPHLFNVMQVCRRFRQVAKRTYDEHCCITVFPCGAYRAATTAEGAQAGSQQGQGSISETIASERAAGRRVANSVSEAISKARPGETIFLEAGRHYLKDSILLTSPLRIIGKGRVAKDTTLFSFEIQDAFVIHSAVEMVNFKVSSRRGTCLEVNSGRVHVRDCTLRCECSPRHCYYCGGDLTCGDCREIMPFDNVIHAERGSFVSVRNCKLKGGCNCVVIANDSHGIFESNEITGADADGVVVSLGACIELRYNRVYDNFFSGIALSRGSRGVIEGNEIAGHSGYFYEKYGSAIRIEDNAVPSSGLPPSAVVVSANRFVNNKIGLYFVQTERTAMTVRNNSFEGNYYRELTIELGRAYDENNNEVATAQRYDDGSMHLTD